MLSFKDKIVWVTGASSGIGLGLVRQLAEEGAKLILSARNKDDLQFVKAKLHQSDQHLVMSMDLRQTATIEEIVSKVIAQVGRIDFLFNNAGTSELAAVSHCTMQFEREMMELNYFGNIALSKAILPVMKHQGFGHVVVTSSLAGKMGYFENSTYCASKHALHGFYESLALEEQKNNIRFTLVCPGTIIVPVRTKALEPNDDPFKGFDNRYQKGLSVAECTDQILKAVKKQRREFLIGKSEIRVVFWRRVLPQRLFWKLVSKKLLP